MQYVSPPQFEPIPPVETIAWPDTVLKDEVSEEGQFYVTWKVKRISNNSVGDSWGFSVTVDGEKVTKAPIRTNSSSIVVNVAAIEYDSVNDVGRGSVTFNLSDIKTQATKTVRVTVRENRGRYAGNTAVWEFTVTVTRK